MSRDPDIHPEEIASLLRKLASQAGPDDGRKVFLIEGVAKVAEGLSALSRRVAELEAGRAGHGSRGSLPSVDPKEEPGDEDGAIRGQ